MKRDVLPKNERNWKEKEETPSIKGQVDTILDHLPGINGINRHLQCQQCHQCPADMAVIHHHVTHQPVYGRVTNKLMHGQVKQIQPSKEQLFHTMVVPKEDMVVLLEVLPGVVDPCPVDDKLKFFSGLFII